MENITLGQIQQIIVFLATFITASTVIIALGRNSLKSCIKQEMSSYCQSMQEQIKVVQEDNKKIHEELKQNSLNTMKNTICNKDIPLSERISVGKKYIEDGGNGAVKVLVHHLEEEYAEELKKEV